MRPLDPDTTQFHGLSWILTRTLYTLATALGFFFAGLAGMAIGGPWAAGGGLVWLTGTLLLVIPTRIRVGPGGLSLRWLWVSLHISLGEIVEITSYDEAQWGRFREIGLRIVLRDGVLHLPMRYHDRLAFWVQEPERETEALMACLCERGPEGEGEGAR